MKQKNHIENKPKPVVSWLLLSLSLTICFIILTYAVFNGFTQSFDDALETTIRAWSNITALDIFFDHLSDQGEIPTLLVIIILTSIFLIWRKKYWQVIFFWIASLGGAIIPEILKDIFQRVRPGVDPSIGLYAYPSGHMVDWVCIFGALIFFILTLVKEDKLILKIFLIFFLITLVIGLAITRIYFGNHYPTDILAGLLIGLIYLALLIAAFNFLFNKGLCATTDSLALLHSLEGILAGFATELIENNE